MKKHVEIDSEKLAEAFQIIGIELSKLADLAEIALLNATPVEKLTGEEKPPVPVVKDSKSGPDFTLEQVRSKLAQLAAEGKTKEIKAALTNFGAEKLSELPQESYLGLLTSLGVGD